MNADRLTEKQLAFLRYVWDYTLAHGHQPSFKEIGAELGIKNRSALVYYVLHLAKKGYVEYEAFDRRIRFLKTPQGTPFQGLRHVA